MMPLVSEAVRISRDFETATFVGAVAIMLNSEYQVNAKPSQHLHRNLFRIPGILT